MADKLGIVAGGGALPASIVAACLAARRDFFVLALEGHADPALLDGLPHCWIRLGNAKKGIDILHKEEVRDLVLAGRVRRPSLSELRPDLRTAGLFARLARGAMGDDTLLSAVIGELESEGFRVIPPESLLSDALAHEGPYGNVAPDDEARRDIDVGLGAARATGAADIGQAVVVQQGVVLGVEAVEGTDALIARCGALQREGPGGVLVKIAKPGQETRVDRPTVGPDTVTAAAKAGLRGIAIEAGGALVLDAEELAARADAAGLFVVGVPVPGSE